MAHLFSILLLFAFTFTSYGQTEKKRIEDISIQLINDIIQSSDFSFQKNKLILIKEDSFARKIFNFSDTVMVDTTRRTKFRLSMADFIEIKTDTLNIIDKPYFYWHKNVIPSKETSEFTVEDIKFMKKQDKLNKKIIWDNRIKGSRILNATEIYNHFKANGANEGWKIFELKYSAHLIEFSVPLFNKDYSKAVIVIDYSCGGLCGYGGIFLCEKKNGKWEITRSYGQTWIS